MKGFQWRLAGDPNSIPAIVVSSSETWTPQFALKGFLCALHRLYRSNKEGTLHVEREHKGEERAIRRWDKGRAHSMSLRKTTQQMESAKFIAYKIASPESTGHWKALRKQWLERSLMNKELLSGWRDYFETISSEEFPHRLTSYDSQCKVLDLLCFIRTWTDNVKRSRMKRKPKNLLIRKKRTGKGPIG